MVRLLMVSTLASAALANRLNLHAEPPLIIEPEEAKAITEKYACQKGQGEAFASLKESPLNTKEGCASLCEETPGCIAFDYTVNEKSGHLEKVITWQLDACRLYRPNKYRKEGDAGFNDREYCQKLGIETPIDLEIPPLGKNFRWDGEWWLKLTAQQRNAYRQSAYFEEMKPCFGIFPCVADFVLASMDWDRACSGPLCPPQPTITTTTSTTSFSSVEEESHPEKEKDSEPEEQEPKLPEQGEKHIVEVTAFEDTVNEFLGELKEQWSILCSRAGSDADLTAEFEGLLEDMARTSERDSDHDVPEDEDLDEDFKDEDFDKILRGEHLDPLDEDLEEALE
mmetsp:Transcript_31653/g.57605  ORF Transcript_31653/g.57605 Transcript_31653/m.57605 type:complete len:339 (+) Transcript_31653:45-1061(+)